MARAFECFVEGNGTVGKAKNRADMVRIVEVVDLFEINNLFLK